MIRPIIKGPDPRLKNVSRVTDIKLDQEALDDLRDTFRSLKNARGLAAVQIGYCIRAFMFRPEKLGGKDILCINPEVLSSSGHSIEAEECLSYPWLKPVQVHRPEQGEVAWYNLDGSVEAANLGGGDFRCFLHEKDHLDGITIDQIRKRP